MTEADKAILERLRNIIEVFMQSGLCKSIEVAESLTTFYRDVEMRLHGQSN